MNATIGTPSEARGRILDTILVDEANRAILPRIAMEVATQTAMTIGDRIRSAFDGDAGDGGVTVRGSDWRRFIASQAEQNDEHAELPELELSDFAFTIAADESGGGGWRDFGGGFVNDLSVWGRGYYNHIDVGGDIDFDGGITGGTIGVDTLLKPNLLAGVSGNLFRSDIEFSQTSPSRTRTGTHEMTAWSVHPYVGWRPSPRTTLWATGGYGMGSLEVTEDGKDCASDRSASCRKSDAMIITFGVGGSGMLLDRSVGRGRFSIEALGDVVFARLIEDGSYGLDSDGGRVRVGLEMAGHRPVWRGTVGGSLEMSYRGDFGDAVRGSGLEVAGGLKVGVPSIGLSVDAEARALMSHSDDVKERGFSGDITWSPGGGDRGPFVSFKPYWGATGDRRDEIWEQGIAEVRSDTGRERRYEVEVGYGVPLMYESGVVKVFARGDIEEGDMTERSGGVDVETVGGISAGYESVDKASRTETEHRAYIKFNKEF